MKVINVYFRPQLPSWHRKSRKCKSYRSTRRSRGPCPTSCFSLDLGRPHKIFPHLISRHLCAHAGLLETSINSVFPRFLSAVSTACILFLPCTLHTNFRPFCSHLQAFCNFFSGHVTQTFMAHTFCKINIVMAAFRKLRYFHKAQIGTGLLFYIYRDNPDIYIAVSIYIYSSRAAIP